MIGYAIFSFVFGSGPQTILLHINDAEACTALYGGTSSGCFVYSCTLVSDFACE
jgi:hypothetical protein